jgi:hypothetical protein
LSSALGNLSLSPGVSHFFRTSGMGAVARQFRETSRVVTISTAVFIAGRHRAVASRVRTLFHIGHRSSPLLWAIKSRVHVTDRVGSS